MHFHKRDNQVTSSKMVIIKVRRLVYQTRHTAYLAAAPACSLLLGPGLPLTAEVQADAFSPTLKLKGKPHHPQS